MASSGEQMVVAYMVDRQGITPYMTPESFVRRSMPMLAELADCFPERLPQVRIIIEDGIVLYDESDREVYMMRPNDPDVSVLTAYMFHDTDIGLYLREKDKAQGNDAAPGNAGNGGDSSCMQRVFDAAERVTREKSMRRFFITNIRFDDPGTAVVARADGGVRDPVDGRLRDPAGRNAAFFEQRAVAHDIEQMLNAWAITLLKKAERCAVCRAKPVSADTELMQHVFRLWKEIVQAPRDIRKTKLQERTAMRRVWHQIVQVARNVRNRLCKLSVCQRCMLRTYCSKECQKKDWPEHKLICPYVTRLRELGVSASGSAGSWTAPE
jgi:hypothetical protein